MKKVFTLVEGVIDISPVRYSVCAFTLAEVLITLSIIGIVAAVTMPGLIVKWQDTAYEKQKTVFNAKLVESTRQMNLNDDLAPYSSTEAFANRFKKYFKITNICKADKLTNCFNKNLYTEAGEEVDVSKLTDSKSFSKDYSTPNVALALMDGSTMLLSYNPDCEAPDPYNTKASTTVCLSYILDVNGNKKPNTIGKDIMAVNVILNTRTCSGVEVDNKCVYPPVTSYEPVYDPEAPQFVNNDNFWLGAKAYCSSIGAHLAALDELYKIFPCGGDGSYTTENNGDSYRVCNTPSENPYNIPGVYPMNMFWADHTSSEDWRHYVDTNGEESWTGMDSEGIPILCIK